MIKSTHFKEEDFTCKCGCGKNNISQALVDRLDELRDAVNFPLVITSGTRCAKHNEAVGGAADSAHLKGLAADIGINDSGKRYRVIAAAVEHFARIGIGKSLIHVDIDETKPQEAAWVYGGNGG
ncbi:MAG: peptidase M15 [Nitrospirae bacterium]|nr:peptidase M15 [Nitrospirota bacterium]